MEKIIEYIDHFIDHYPSLSIIILVLYCIVGYQFGILLRIIDPISPKEQENDRTIEVSTLLWPLLLSFLVIRIIIKMYQSLTNVNKKITEDYDDYFY